MRALVLLLVGCAGCSKTVKDAVVTLGLERSGDTSSSTLTVRGMTCAEVRDDPGRISAVRLQTKRRFCRKACGWSEADPPASAACRVDCDAATAIASERCDDRKRTLQTPWMRLH